MGNREFWLSEGCCKLWQERMLSQGKIPGFLVPAFHTEDKGRKMVYKREGLRPLKGFLQEKGTRKLRLEIFSRIVQDCLNLEQEYLLPVEWACLDIDEMAVDRYGRQVYMICVPENRTELPVLAAQLLEGIWEQEQETPYGFEEWLHYAQELQERSALIAGPEESPSGYTSFNEPEKEPFGQGIQDLIRFRMFEEPKLIAIFLAGLFVIGLLLGIIS